MTTIRLADMSRQQRRFFERKGDRQTGFTRVNSKRFGPVRPMVFDWARKGYCKQNDPAYQKSIWPKNKTAKPGRMA